jgi:PIN domain nuclease of toxin-antitoxin system
VRILVDTHVLLWWHRQHRRISRPLLAAIEDENNEILVSAASVWEIAIKRAIGKLRFDRPIVASVLALGFEILPVEVPTPSMPVPWRRITPIHLIGS